MKRLHVTIFLILIAFFVLDTIAEVTNYRGFKVFRVNSENKEQYAALQQLQEENEFDFWSDPMINRNVDIMASPQTTQKLTNFLDSNGITFRTMIDDVETLVKKERISIRDHELARTQSGIDWESFYSYQEIIDWADNLHSSCPGLITHEVFGLSTEGRELKVYKVSTGAGMTRKPAIWIDGTFHAREWISPATVTYFLNELCLNATANMDFLNHVDFYIAPFINPDGYEYSRLNTRMWRKTRKNHNSPSGCIGVDPNRNFDFHFGGAGTSNDTCSDIYRGPNPWSEPEAAALRDYLLNTTINWQVYITVHTYGQYILIPYSYENIVTPPDFAEMLQLATDSANAMTTIHGSAFTVGQSADTLGPTAGCADDWAKAEAGIKYAYTYELRDTGTYGFLLPAKFIIPTAEETTEAFKFTARTFIP